MPREGYKAINIRKKDFITFRELKKKLKIQDDIDAFPKIVEMANETLNGNNNIQEITEGVAG
jgi:hypothetical protein